MKIALLDFFFRGYINNTCFIAKEKKLNNTEVCWGKMLGWLATQTLLPPAFFLILFFFVIAGFFFFLFFVFGPITASGIRDQTHVPWSGSPNQSPKPWTPGISHHCLLFMSSFHTSCIHTCVIFHRWNCAMHTAIFFLSLCHRVLWVYLTISSSNHPP